jgi:hypothetical protein
MWDRAFLEGSLGNRNGLCGGYSTAKKAAKVSESITAAHF